MGRQIRTELVEHGVDVAELEARARLPPEYLFDYRVIYNGAAPETSGQRKLAKLFEEKPKEFMAEWRAAEREYRIHVLGMAKPGGKGVGEQGKEDEVSLPSGDAERTAQAWLEECLAESKGLLERSQNGPDDSSTQ